MKCVHLFFALGSELEGKSATPHYEEDMGAIDHSTSFVNDVNVWPMFHVDDATQPLTKEEILKFEGHENTYYQTFSPSPSAIFSLLLVFGDFAKTRGAHDTREEIYL